MSKPKITTTLDLARTIFEMHVTECEYCADQNFCVAGRIMLDNYLNAVRKGNPHRNKS